jgi:hypothetical protein
MTANWRSKRAIRSRMEQTGEKYTQARRALMTSDVKSRGAGEDPPIPWPQDSLGWFTDQAHNASSLPDIREITAAVIHALPGEEDS